MTTELPAFTINPDTLLLDILGTTVASQITTEALEKTRVSFESNIAKNMFIVYNGNLYRPPPKVYADVDTDGAITQDGLPVKLLANDDALSVSEIQYTVTVMVPTAGGVQIMAPWTFDAPAAGAVVDLSDTVPVALVDAVGVSKGPKGDSVDDVKLIGGELVFYVDEESIGEPIDFTSAIGQTYTQASPAATWTIANALGRPARMVNVFIANDLVDADVTVPNDSTSSITVTFATPQTGRAEIN